jgi:hypothetical protein
LPACNRYRLNVNLIAAATEDVKDMPEAVEKICTGRLRAGDNT